MPQKKTIEDAKNIAKDKNWKLLSTEYINCRMLLKWQCNRKHIFDMSFQHAQIHN